MSEENTFMEMELPDNAEVIALGMEAQQFTSSSLGRYLIGCAERDANKAMNLLMKADPTNTSEIIKLQSTITRLRDFESWLDEVITAGNMAYQAYLEETEVTE